MEKGKNLYVWPIHMTKVGGMLEGGGWKGEKNGTTAIA